MAKKIHLSFFLLLLCNLIAAQQQATSSQAASDLVRINAAYSKTQQLKMDVSYLLYPGYTSTAPAQQEKGVFMKQGKSVYSELLGVTSLSNNAVSLTIDKNEQVIIVADPLSGKKTAPGAIDLDTLLKTCSSIEYAEKEGDVKCYKLRFDKSGFSQYNAIDIYFNGQTFLLSKLVLYFREEADLDEEGTAYTKDRPRLEISYSGIDTAPVFESSTFSEKRYIIIAGKNITCTSTYATYHLINNKIK